MHVPKKLPLKTKGFMAKKRRKRVFKACEKGFYNEVLKDSNS
jgi:hypothetical protein